MKTVPVVKITALDADARAGSAVGSDGGDVRCRRCDERGSAGVLDRGGVGVMRQMLTEELAGMVGPKHAELGPDRVGNWHGTTTGQVVLGSQKVTVARPCGRYVDGGEVELATWRRSPPRTCRARSSWNGCSPGWPPAATQVADPFHVVHVVASPTRRWTSAGAASERNGRSRGRRDDPLYRCRRRLVMARERLSVDGARTAPRAPLRPG